MELGAEWKTWAGRGAIVAAAMAAMATSPARWSIAAAPPATPARTSATLFTVEASQLPHVAKRDASGESGQADPLDAFANGAWPGRADYLLPAGETIDGAVIMDICANAGMCDGRCVPPPGAFVRFGRVEAVSEWVMEVESDPQTMTVGPATSAAFVVAVDASRKVTVTARAMGNVDDLALLDPASIYPEPQSKYKEEHVTTKHAISWKMRWDAPASTPPRPIPWVAHVTMRGYCRGANDSACRAPQGERLRIVSIAPKAAQ
jgi:hypothetical protein